MSVYILFYLIVSILAILMSRVKKSQEWVVVSGSFFVLSLFSGLRGSVGSDTLNYIEIYKDSPELFNFFGAAWSVEPGFLLINSIHKILFNSEFLFILFLSLFQVFLLIVLVKKNRNPSLFLVVYLLVFYLNFHFNIVRAGTATLLLLLSLQASSQRGAVTYFSLGLLFHVSIVVAFPFIILVREFSFNKLIVGMLGGTFLLLGGYYLYFDYIVLKVISYAGNDAYLRSNYPIVFMFTFFVFVVSWVSRKGGVSKSYFFSGLFLLASLALNFFMPEFYRITVIFLILFFWYMVNEFKSPISVYALCFYLFFFYHAGVKMGSIYYERENLNDQIRSGDSRITKDTLDSSYIPYGFYWNDFD